MPFNKINCLIISAYVYLKIIASKFITVYCFWHTVMIKHGNLYFTYDSKRKITACTLLKRTCFISFGCVIKVGCNMVTWHLSTMHIFCCSVTWNSSENNHLYFFFLSMPPYTCEPFWKIKEKKEWSDITGLWIIAKKVIIHGCPFCWYLMWNLGTQVLQ